jgi:hypothetical protein
LTLEDTGSKEIPLKRPASGLARSSIESIRRFICWESNGRTFYLQTERHDGGLYARLGWQPLEEVHYHGVDVLVMGNQVSA